MTPSRIQALSIGQGQGALLASDASPLRMILSGNGQDPKSGKHPGVVLKVGEEQQEMTKQNVPPLSMAILGSPLSGPDLKEGQGGISRFFRAKR